MYIQMHLHDISEILLKVALDTINWNRKTCHWNGSTFSAMKYIIASTTSMDNGWDFIL